MTPCFYCGKRIPLDDVKFLPEPRDDAAWARVALWHEPSCRWVQCRGRMPVSEVSADLHPENAALLQHFKRAHDEMAGDLERRLRAYAEAREALSEGAPRLAVLDARDLLGVEGIYCTRIVGWVQRQGEPWTAPLPVLCTERWGAVLFGLQGSVWHATVLRAGNEVERSWRVGSAYTTGGVVAILAGAAASVLGQEILGD